jgi:uncharacterized repeat protein (TIGR03803 family)
MHTFVSTTLGRAARLTVALAVLALAVVAQTPSLTTIYSFTGAGGGYTGAGVVFGTGAHSTSLFGTTPHGGSANFGTAFELTPGATWSQTVLYNFQGGNDGASPLAALTPGKGGVLYGTTSAGGNSGNGTVFQLTPPAKTGDSWTETVLYNFQGNGADGTVDVNGTTVTLTSGSSFVTGTAWNGVSVVIGTATYTVANVVSSSVLTLTTSAGTQTGVLYSTADGSGPAASVTLFPNGKLYGTTFGGGALYENGAINGGFGTVFELTPPAGGTGAWTETLVYVFGSGKFGSGPASEVIAYKGNLYSNTCCGTVGGTVFKLTPPGEAGGEWAKPPVYSFSSGEVGENPIGGLAINADGVLYGTTIEGGADGQGIIFSLTPTTKGKPYTLTTIHTFTNGTDGGAPYGGVVLGPNGVLYATVTTGCDFSAGGVLQFTPPTGSGPWTETVLYSFTGGSDGSQPVAGVTLGSNNALYGTTEFDGASGYGTVYELIP